MSADLFYGNSIGYPTGLHVCQDVCSLSARREWHRGYALSGSGSVEISVRERATEKSIQQQGACVLGDLSFFYDQNALWNQNLDGSLLGIIVLNNGGGAIFGKFEGLKQSDARERLVMAEHHTSAVKRMSGKQHRLYGSR